MSQLFRKKNISDLLKEGGDESHGGSAGLKRVLSVRDLTFFGIAAIDWIGWRWFWTWRDYRFGHRIG
jgi:hypothetical protein